MLISKTDYASITKTIKNGLEFLHIDHPSCQASVSLYGGQVLSWRPYGHQDVFWMSDNAKFEQGTAIRGGIPLCWPWFGGWKGHGNHGFARQSLWRLDEVDISDDKVKLVLVLAAENLHPNWPYQFNLMQTLVFAKDFTQELVFTNLSSEDVEYCGALHTYFAVQDVAKISLPELSDIPFDCKLSQMKGKVQALDNGIGPFDRIYQSNNKQQIIDEIKGRTISVTSKGCNQWVVWNPGQAISSSMTDMHSGAEKEFVCIEAANTHWMTVKAGGSAIMSQSVEVENTNQL